MAEGYRMDMVGGIDVGNGYVKGKVSIDGASPVRVDLPSCAAWVSETAGIAASPDDALMGNLMNEIDCDIVSSAIPRSEQHRIIMGERAVASGATPIIFDIDDSRPKCDDPLSYDLILGSLTSLALGEFWKRARTLPTEILHVTAILGLALPITDYTAYARRYSEALTGGVHTVHVHNFDRDLTVEVTIADVIVLPEGAAAQYAISDLGPDFMQAALDAARASGIAIDESETGESILGYLNTLGIDIGEGTVNFPVFRDGRVSVESSSSINKGYGTVLSSVVTEVRNLAYAPQSRKDLAQFMLKANPNPRDRKLQAKLRHYIDAQADVFCRDVIMEYNRVMNRVKLGVDVVYVYGGGANAMRESLYPQLIEASRLDDDLYTPVIWLDSTYSRDLNRNGLYLAATAIADQARA